jgi:GT2 family glycosyltransferase
LSDLTRIGAVVIGRNEGARLGESLAALRAQSVPIVYVDSGSTDASVSMAREAGAEVVELDANSPFTAARARNAGLARLTELHPALEKLQFVDGDCVLEKGWINDAAAFLDERKDVAIVTGRLTEQHRDASIYNALCALEWQRPVGEIPACGGIFMARAGPMKEVGGFRDDLQAGEEGELCLRLREKEWKIWSLDTPMASHDAAMTHFSQWWRRARRAGFAYAQGAAMHGNSPERHCVRDCRRIWFWGLILPLAAIVPAWWTRGWSLLLLLAYALLAARIYITGRRRKWTPRDARIHALFTILAKWPGLLGMLEYHLQRFRRR